MWKYIDEFDKSSSPEPLCQFYQTLHKSSLNEGNSNFWNEEPFIFPSGDDYEIAKIHWRIWKNRLLQNHLANINQSNMVKGILNYLNGALLFPRGDDYEIVKYIDKI